MKKSFKILLLAVMALCLAAGAAFAGISSDVKIDVTSADLVSLVEHGIESGKSDGLLSSDNASSDAFEISFDVTFNKGTAPCLQLKFTSDDGVSVDIISSDKTDGVKIIKGTSTTTSNDVSFDVSIISTDAVPVYLTVRISDDTNSGDVIVKVVINAKAVKPAFTSAKVPVYAAGKLVDTVTFTSADAKKSVTVSTDVTVSLDLSAASVDLVSVDGKGKTSTDLSAANYVFSTDIESSSKDVYIYFTSGDASFEAKLTINVDSGDSSSSGGDDGEKTSITVDDIDEETQEAIEDIIPSKYSSTITLGKLVEQLNKLIAVLTGVTFDTVSVDTAGDFGTVTAVKSDGTVVAAAFPAVNGSVFLPVNSGTISNSFPSSLPSFDEAVTAFGFTDFSDFTGKVFDEVTSLTERDADFTEDVATETFNITLGSALPYGTIVVFALQPTDDTLNLATQYVAMVINGTFGDTSSTLTFDMNKVYNAADLQTKASITEGEYDIAYSTLDGAGKGVESAALKAAFEAAAAGEEGEVGYVGAVTLGTSSSEETTNETSSHGSSSGCDAGFGALALLAVAGALATRKVRK